MTIDEVSESTYCLRTGTRNTRYPYSVYFLTEDQPILIEPGPALLNQSILDAMKHLGLKQLSYIIPTHIHMDHGGGTGKLAQSFPEAKVIVHPRAAKHAIDPSRLIEPTKLAYSDNIEHLYGAILPIPESQVQTVADGEIIPIGERELCILHTPGHAAHHMSIFDRKTHGLFCGEALGVPIPRMNSLILPSVSVGDLDVDLYLSSIEKLERLKPRVLFYSHRGGVITPDSIFSRLIENTVTLRDVILEGLRSGDTTEQIKQRIQERLAGSTDTRVEAISMKGIIAGYTAYFKKKSLI